MSEQKLINDAASAIGELVWDWAGIKEDHKQLVAFEQHLKAKILPDLIASVKNVSNNKKP